MAAPRHIEFGSTPRFDKLYIDIKRATDNTGRLFYAKYDPSLGEPPTEGQKQLMADYAVDMPIITFSGSEKLHGENMAICYNDIDGIYTQGRNTIRTIEQDQNGMALATITYIKEWGSIFRSIIESGVVDTSTHTICIFAEWAGGNIQKGNAACSGTDKAVYIFDYFYISPNDGTQGTWESTSALLIPDSVPIYLMSSFQSYEATLNFEDPVACEEILNTLALYVEEHSPIAKYFDKTDNVGEGVYLWADYNGTKYRVKAKGEKHGGKPKLPKNQSPTAPAEVKALQDLAEKLTPVWRINQAIDECNATTRKSTGNVLKWVNQDIAKEETEALVAAGYEFKQVSNYVSRIVKEYFFDSLKDY